MSRALLAVSFLALALTARAADPEYPREVARWQEVSIPPETDQGTPVSACRSRNGYGPSIGFEAAINAGAGPGTAGGDLPARRPIRTSTEDRDVAVDVGGHEAGSSSAPYETDLAWKGLVGKLSRVSIRVSVIRSAKFH